MDVEDEGAVRSWAIVAVDIVDAAKRAMEVAGTGSVLAVLPVAELLEDDAG